MTKLAWLRHNEEMGKSTVATTTANMVVGQKQIADIECTGPPDRGILVPIDADALSSTCKKVSEAGSSLFGKCTQNGLAEGLIMWNGGKRYYGIGAGCAHMLARDLVKRVRLLCATMMRISCNKPERRRS